MIKKIYAVLICCFTCFTTFAACPDALPTNHVNFCASFKQAAICYCITSGMPAFMCQDVNQLYNRMIALFGSLQGACNYQKYISPQICMDNWNCYRQGGVDSRGNICSSTKASC